MINVLELPSEDVAIALGHTDGGVLVRKLYGHRDQERPPARVTAATRAPPASRRYGWCEAGADYVGGRNAPPKVPIVAVTWSSE